MQLRLTDKAYRAKLPLSNRIKLWKWKLLLNALLAAKFGTEVALDHFFTFPVGFWLLANVAGVLDYQCRIQLDAFGLETFPVDIGQGIDRLLCVKWVLSIVIANDDN